MLDRFYIGALSLLLVFYSEVVELVPLRWGKSEHDILFFKDGNATGEEGLPHEPALLFSREGPTATIGKDTLTEKHFPWMSRIRGSTSALKEFASRTTEILDRISKNWALEGAKTIQKGEVRLRKMNKDLREKIEELVMNGFKYSRHIMHCLNMTVFEAGLEKIVDDIAECYSRPLVPVQLQLKKIEEEEDAVLDRMEDYGRGMFESLSACFSQEDIQLVIECLQKVEGTNTGDRIRGKDASNLMLEMAHFINDIPRAYSECTSKGIVETEAHVRKGYAESLSCLKNY